MQAKSATNVKVIDISHHQNDRGKIDWTKVIADGSPAHSSRRRGRIGP